MPVPPATWHISTTFIITTTDLSPPWQHGRGFNRGQRRKKVETEWIRGCLGVCGWAGGLRPRRHHANSVQKRASRPSVDFWHTKSKNKILPNFCISPEVLSHPVSPSISKWRGSSIPYLLSLSKLPCVEFSFSLLCQLSRKAKLCLNEHETDWSNFLQ